MQVPKDNFYLNRKILLLLPLICLAICTWILSSKNTPDLIPPIREMLLKHVRLIFPALVSVCIALLVDVPYRKLQISLTILSYIITCTILYSYSPNMITQPVICVFSSCATIIVLLPRTRSGYETLIAKKELSFFDILLALLMPIVVLCGLIAILNQIHDLIVYTISSSQTHKISFMFLPIYFIIQAFGVQNYITDLALIKWLPEISSNFANTIILTNMFTLPATIICRAFFEKGDKRLFLVFLGITCVLVSSVGSALSVIFLITIFLYPGSFVIILLSSIATFFMAQNLIISNPVSIVLLYRPDLDLTEVLFLHLQVKDIVLTEIFTIIFPIALLSLTMFLKEHSFSFVKDYKKHQRTKNLYKGDKDLITIALIKALGGLNNIIKVKIRNRKLKFYLVDLNTISNSDLKDLSISKIEIEKLNNSLIADLGDATSLSFKRINKLLTNELSLREHEIKLQKPFEIKSMPHIKS